MSQFNIHRTFILNDPARMRKIGSIVEQFAYDLNQLTKSPNGTAWTNFIVM